MNEYFLPKHIKKVVVPPLKCQGIKTKLVNFIATTIKWHGRGKWIEPFLGSGVVLFNINPDRAIVSDTNKHIINFYKDIQRGQIDEIIVKSYLEDMGAKLFKYGEDFFYDVRDQFNEENGDSLKLLFLNRCCYNGIMRFNSQGKFNVPFGHKHERFRRAYITKIVKGRHTDYYNNWNESDAIELANFSSDLKCGFALSMWKENKYRENIHLDLHWNGFVIKTFSHFYHVGSKEKFRNAMTEALVLKAENLVDQREEKMAYSNSTHIKQISIFD